MSGWRPVPAGSTGGTVREWVKSAVRGIALLAALPWLLSFWIRSPVMGRNRALEGSTQSLAWLPGFVGQYVRRAFLQRALAHCSHTAVVEFGTIFSQAGARLDDGVYVGPRCHLGLVHLEQDVLVAAGVHIPSGGGTHAFDDLSQPIREQESRRTLVRVGAGAWIGSAAVVLADVGRGCVVGAGAVVTRPLPDNAVAAGVPARVIRVRTAQSPDR
jgi:acetyltransferase-like isoleucine patch superfamily enzyme